MRLIDAKTQKNVSMPSGIALTGDLSLCYVRRNASGGVDHL